MIADPSHQLEYGYNLAGQLVSEKYPSGRVVNMTVDNFGRLSTVTDSQRSYLTGVSFNNQGLLSQMNLGNGTSETFSYNDRFQMTGQSLTKGAEVLQKYDYSYGQADLNTGTIDATKNNGQLGKIEGWIGANKQRSQRFGYDELGRLSEAREYKRGDNAQLTYKQKFEFDRFGNMYRKAASNGPTGQQNPLPYTPIEDADISKSTNRFATQTTYDDAGQVVTDNKFRAMSFADDGDGQKVRTDGMSGSVATVPTYEIRSTVLGGETVGEYRAFAEYPKKIFTVPVVGGKLKYTNIVNYSESISFTRTSPEGLMEYDGDNPTVLYDPRGADVGLDEPTEPGFVPSAYGWGNDPGAYDRCAEGGVLVSCDKQARFDKRANEIFNQIWTQWAKEAAISAASSAHRRGAASGDPQRKINREVSQSPEARATIATDKPASDPEIAGTVDSGLVPDASGNNDGCTWSNNGNPNCTVESQRWLYSEVDASVGGSDLIEPLAGRPTELPKCLRDFLRPFFPNVQIGSFQSFSPVDDARFIETPRLGKVAAAMTLGLYDIRYDPKLVDLTGAEDKSSIGTIAEEIAHTVQFIAVWERVENQTKVVSGSYYRARDTWVVDYLGESGKIVAKNVAKAAGFWITGVPGRLGDTYQDNKYEREAKEKARVVSEAAKKLANSPCY